MEPRNRTNRPARTRSKAEPCRSRTVSPDASDTELSRLIQNYFRTFQPRNEEEALIDEALVRAEWLTRCLWRLETDLCRDTIRELRALEPDAPPTTLLALAYFSLAEAGGPLDEIGFLLDGFAPSTNARWRGSNSCTIKSKNFQTK